MWERIRNDSGAVVISYRKQTHHEKDEGAVFHDRYNVANICFFVIGVGMLLPWNFFINANEYFEQKLQNNKNDQHLFESAFSICSQVPCGVALMLNIYLTNRVSRNRRVFATLSAITVCFIITTVLVNINTESWTTTFFIVTLINIIIINFTSGIFQGTIFGMAGVLGKRYSQATTIGMSFAGTFASLVNIASMMLGRDTAVSSTAYFTLATLVTVGCIAASGILFRMKALRMQLRQHDSKKGGYSTLSAQSNKNIVDVLKVIYPLALSIMCSYAVTLVLMPSILSGMQSVHTTNESGSTQKYFTATVGFLIFNLGDLIGRIIPGFVRFVDKNNRWLPVLCSARLAFIPLLMLCNYQPRSHLPVIFSSDVYPIIFNILFAVSNGYLTSICVMYAPDMVTKEMAETSAAIIQAAIVIGMGLGAALSFMFVKLI